MERRGARDDGRVLLARFGLAGKGVLHLGIGVALCTSWGSDGTEVGADTVFDLPMGRWLVFASGAALMTLAVHLAMVHALDGRFLERLCIGERSPAAWAGRIGYGLRSVAYLLLGFFLAQAGLTHDPAQAEGLTGSLRRVAEESWGPAMLVVSAVGFLAYGVYCFVESALRRAA